MSKYLPGDPEADRYLADPINLDRIMKHNPALIITTTYDPATDTTTVTQGSRNPKLVRTEKLSELIRIRFNSDNGPLQVEVRAHRDNFIAEMLKPLLDAYPDWTGNFAP